MRSCGSGSPGRWTGPTPGAQEARRYCGKPGPRSRAPTRQRGRAKRRRSAIGGRLAASSHRVRRGCEAAGHAGGVGEFGLVQLGQQAESADPAAERPQEGVIGGRARRSPCRRPRLRTGHAVGMRQAITGWLIILSWRRVLSGRCLPAGSTSVVKTRRSVSPGVRELSRPGLGADEFGMHGPLGRSQTAHGRERSVNLSRPRAAVRMRGTGFGPRHRCTAADPGAQRTAERPDSTSTVLPPTPRFRSSQVRPPSSRNVHGRISPCGRAMRGRRPRARDPGQRADRGTAVAGGRGAGGRVIWSLEEGLVSRQLLSA